MNDKSYADTLRSTQKGVSGPADTAAEPLGPDLADQDGPYQAHARASNKPVPALHCLLGKEGVRSFLYRHLDSDSQFRITSGGQVLVMRFGGIKAVQVTIRGRNLWRLYDYLHQERMPWVRVAERDFAADREPIITAIDFEDVV